MKPNRSIAVCCFGLLFVVFGFSFVLYETLSFESTSEWQLAANHAPPGLMAHFEEDKIGDASEYNTDKMTVRKISQPGQTQPLYLINTQISDESERDPLCGVAGCLFLGYIRAGGKDYEPVFEFYLDPQVSVGFELFEIDMTLRNEMPVIYVNQRSSPVGTALVKATLIFNGNEYVVTRVD